MDMNEYEGCVCPECGDANINLYGWCDSCSFDYEESQNEANETENDLA